MCSLDWKKAQESQILYSNKRSDSGSAVKASHIKAKENIKYTTEVFSWAELLTPEIIDFMGKQNNYPSTQQSMQACSNYFSLPKEDQRPVKHLVYQ